MVRAHRRLRSYLLNALLIIFNMMGSAGSLLDRVGEEVLYPPLPSVIRAHLQTQHSLLQAVMFLLLMLCLRSCCVSMQWFSGQCDLRTTFAFVFCFCVIFMLTVSVWATRQQCSPRKMTLMSGLTALHFIVEYCFRVIAYLLLIGHYWITLYQIFL